MVKHKMMPLPDANVGEVLGLVEIIYSYGCKVKISFLSEELRMQLDDLGDVIDMAELLNLVKVKKGEATLTAYGEALNLGTIENKKTVLHNQLAKVEPFKTTVSLVKKNQEVSTADLMDYLQSHKMPVEDENRFHKIFLSWIGYAELLEYDGQRQVFHLPHPSSNQ